MLYKTKKETLIREFAEVINRNSAENERDTPDFLLAQYLVGCLENLNEAIVLRKALFQRKGRSFRN